MARTVNGYIDLMTHAVGVASSSGIDSRHVLIDTFNDAARYVFEYRPWSFRKASVYLRFPQAITFTTGSYAETAGVHTITKTASFANYRFTPGDILTISAGAGVTAGDYRIAGKTSADVITLVEDPGSTSTSDVTGSIAISAVTAPTDFGQLLSIGVDNTEGLSGDFTAVRLVTPEDIVWMRENFFQPVDGLFYLAVQPTFPTIDGVQSTTTTTAATPLWPCYPLPESGSQPTLLLSYMRSWTDLAAGTGIPPFPAQFTRALALACRAFAVEFENQTPASENQPLMDELARLAREQGGAQTDFGPIRGGVSTFLRRPEHVVLGDAVL